MFSQVRMRLEVMLVEAQDLGVERARALRTYTNLEISYAPTSALAEEAMIATTTILDCLSAARSRGPPALLR